MKIDFSQVIRDPKGEPAKQDGEDLTLGSVVATAMFSILPNDEQLSASKKAKMGNLGIAVVNGGEHDVSVDDLSMAKERVAKIYGALVVARVVPMLDPKAKED